MKKLYLVYAERNKKDGLISHANIGETNQARTEDRFLDNDYRRKAMGGNLVLAKDWEFDGHSDREVHSILEARGFKRNPDNTANTEEFEFNLPEEEIVKLVSEIVIEVKHGVSNRLNDFKMRPHQQDCHDKVIKAFSNGYDKFLIGAIMRFGKTFVTYQIMRTLGSNLTFVVTYKTNDVLNAWRAEIENHVDFKDYRFLNVKDSNLKLLQSSEKTVVFISVPYLLNDAGAKDKNWIYNLRPDLLIVDEQHYGSATPNFKEIVDKLNPVKKIELSGTPYKTYARGTYPDDCIYRWDSLPIKMNLFSIDLAKHVVKDLNNAGFINEDGFHINKFFEADKNGFIFHRDVELTMRDVFGLNPLMKNRDLFSPFSIREITDKESLNHILLRLESVDSAVAMKKMLSNMLSEYKIIMSAGSDPSVIKDADGLQSIISENDKTITITVGRFETGVTIPQWGSVFFMNGGSSLESYYQTGYRASSQYESENWVKKSFNVFDFDPSRSFEMVYLNRAVLKKSGESLKQSFENFFDCANVYAVDGNRFVKLNSEQLIDRFETLISKRDPVSEITSEYGMNDLKLSTNAIVALTGVDPEKAKKISLLMTTNNLPKGKVKNMGTLLKLDKKDKEAVNNLIQKMKTVCSRIPIVVIASEYVDLDSLLADRNNQSFFKKVTGITLDDYRDMLDTGALNREWQERAITRINNLSEAIKPEVY